MVLTSGPDGGDVREPSRTSPLSLTAYVTGVCLLGALGVVLAVAGTSWPDVIHDVDIWPVAFLVVAAIVGEMRPLTVSRGEQPVETLSTSAPFVLALLAVAGVGPAVAVQALASLGDDLAHRRSPQKSLFNISQYVLAVLAARGVFCLLSREQFFSGPVPVDGAHLMSLIVAGFAMVLVNRGLVAVVAAIVTEQPIGRMIREDVGFYASTQFVLLCIGAVAAAGADKGIGFLVLLVAPVVVVYTTTASAIRHAHQASHDSLTGLWNRDRLTRHLEYQFAAAPGAGPGLILIDLDHFKDINDTLGHPVGDELLKRVAQRLVSALDDSSSAHRLGGDEFAVLIDGNLAETEALARDLLATLEAPVRVGDVELLVRASAGVAVAPAHGLDAETLMKRADIALYQAKLDRDRMTTYSDDLDVNTVERLQLLADLRGAIDSGQLGVAYQPQVDLLTNRTVGVEALIRWEHPTRGAVPPDRFIPLAENSGLIATLTRYVLHQALRSMAEWRAAGFDVRLAVNLSARHLSDLALAGQVHDTLALYDVPASSLTLEVTETGIMSDPSRADVVIDALRRLGVAIAVDDYGTGHASLSYLKRLEVDELKIDRSFVSDMGDDPSDYIIVRSTIALAHDLGLRVVAEGIEDETTARSLRDLGCGIGQGFWLGVPTSSAQIIARLAAETDAHASGGMAR